MSANILPRLATTTRAVIDAASVSGRCTSPRSYVGSILFGALFFGSPCSAKEAPTSPDVEVIAPAGFSISSPRGTLTRSGLNLQGWICRRNHGTRAPHHLQLDRLTSDGAILATASTHIHTSAGFTARCTLYRFETDWVIAPDERLRLCAADQTEVCRAVGK